MLLLSLILGVLLVTAGATAAVKGNDTDQNGVFNQIATSMTQGMNVAYDKTLSFFGVANSDADANGELHQGLIAQEDLEHELEYRLRQGFQVDLSGQDQLHIDGVGGVAGGVVPQVTATAQGQVSGAFAASQDALGQYNQQLAGSYGSYQEVRGDSYTEINAQARSLIEAAAHAAAEASGQANGDIEVGDITINAGAEGDAHARLIAQMVIEILEQADANARSSLQAKDELAGGLYERSYGEYSGSLEATGEAAAEAETHAYLTMEAFENAYAEILNELEFTAAAQQELRGETEAQVDQIVLLHNQFDEKIMTEIEAQMAERAQATLEAAADLEAEAHTQKRFMYAHGYSANQEAQREARTQADATMQAAAKTSASLRAQADLILGLEAEVDSIVQGALGSSGSTLAGVTGATPVGGAAGQAAAQAANGAYADLSSNLRTELRAKANILLDVSAQVEADAEARAGLLMEASLYSSAKLDGHIEAQADLVFDAWMQASTDVRASAGAGVEASLEVAAEARAVMRSSLHMAARATVEAAYVAALDTQVRLSGNDGVTLDLGRDVRAVLDADADVLAQAASAFEAEGSTSAKRQAEHWFAVNDEVSVFADGAVDATAGLVAEYDATVDLVADLAMYYEAWLEQLSHADAGAYGGLFSDV